MSEPRKFSDIKAERDANDPVRRRRIQVMDEIRRLESVAQATGDKATQCDAEELRCMLHFDYLIPEEPT